MSDSRVFEKRIRPRPAKSLFRQKVNFIIPVFAVLALISGAIFDTAPARDATEDFGLRFGDAWPNTDFSRRSVSPSEFLSGGPSRDGIPSIDDPRFERLKDGKAQGWARALTPQAPVIVVSENGETRAYPLEVLLWHEIVNDTLGGVPIAVTYCPLCNTALVFRRDANGRELDFGTTGMLRTSNLVMYDRQTESWWQQFGGTAIVGEMTGTALELVPSRVESFENFTKGFPDGELLVPDDPDMRPYGKTPYAGYDTGAEPLFFNGEVTTAPLAPMSSVVVLRGKDGPVAFDVAYLRKARKASFETFDIEWHPGMTSVLDAREVRDGRDVGQVTVGRSGAPAAHEITFAFVFRSFYPDGLIVTHCEPGWSYANVECR